jgi:prepilin-type N-terminal cleavage/methylation domain-containing protein
MSVRKNHGFTLFELLMTIAIAGILLGIAIPSFQSIRVNSSVSSLAAEAVLSIAEARNRAITTRSRVYVVQGPGTSETDIDTVTADDWASGWRLMTGPSLATATLISRNDKQRKADDGGDGAGKVSLFVTDKTVDDAGSADGDKINGFGFNNFGQLIDLDGNNMESAAIVVCAPNSSSEKGRAISVSSLGRVTNTVVINPESCS